MYRKRYIRNLIAALLLGVLLVPLAPVGAAPTTSPGQTELRPGQRLNSPDGRFQLVHQHDGNVVLYEGLSRPVWNSRTAGQDTSHLVFQADGNLVLYGQGRALWNTRTHGKGNALAVQNDANLVIYNSSTPVWAIKGMTPPTPPRDQRGSTSDGCGGWRHTISYHFGAETARACRVMMCESQGNRYADNPRSSASGLFQFLDGTWRNTTGTPAPAKAYSPDTQTRAAKRLRDTSGWSQWVCR